MRVISQDGKFDCPYEHIALGIISENLKVSNAASKVIAYPIPQTQDDDYYYMAKYSTEEKAKRALEKLHDKYLSRMELDGGFDTVNNCYVQPNFWVLPRIFQFPNDEDVEA